ncbi:MAG: 2-dehydropantoate 2-reductase [Bacteroidetes bacterium]|nr:2-dehydropantoate 2-reductase [Bacteroidota bacterium]
MKNAMDSAKIKIGVVGLGPVGMILAVKLKEAGCDVALCDKDEFKLKKIREEGIVLENIIESKTVFDKVYDSPRDMRHLDLDYLVFSLKTYQTLGAAKEAEILNSDKITLVSAQNGIDSEKLVSSVFGESKTLRMVINYAGNLRSPNTVRVSFVTPPNYVGSIDDSRTKQAERFAGILNSVGFATERLDSFELVKSTWEKTILNSSLSALCGVGRLTMMEAMADADTMELIEQIINEGIDVAEKEKVRFPDDFLRKCMLYLRKGGDHFPSLAVDLINNRQTEIDYFNGKIVEYGKKHYVKTSLNLAFTNMVKAMTNKNVLARFPGVEGELNKIIISKGLVDKNKPSVFYQEQNCFMGIDLGSAFTKFTIVDENGNPVFRYVLQTMNKDRHAMKNILKAIHSTFKISHSCATGYGRKHFTDTDIVKTEINCASAGVSEFFGGEKNIIDIGGEDIKIIHCDYENHVANFYMNDKCAAGTGAFLEEISERAEINISEMSSLASNSEYNRELNSFCTVFAKTEIMNWVFDGMPRQDIARGIYISIANKVAKMRLYPNIPTFMIGGVIAHHPYLNKILCDKFNIEIKTVDQPQYIVSFGAAMIARLTWLALHPLEIKQAETLTH